MSTPLRKTRRPWDEPGHAHFLTFSCWHRWPLLSRDRSRQWVIDSLEATRRNLDVALWAYVIMPEHVHVLLRPRQAGCRVRRVLANLKRGVSDKAREHLESTGNREWLERLTFHGRTRTVFRFWQPGGGYDQNIFKEKTVGAIMEYIHANPVRRGLARFPTDWIWSSARFWDGCKDVPIQMDNLES